MAVDAAMRKLQVPPRFMPYLEKHRIYELFHDLGNQLAMFQPTDSLVFLNQCLSRLDKGRDRRLIILMTPPHFDTIKLAHLLSVRTGCGIMSRYIACLKPGDFFDPDALAENTANLIRESDKDGWILADYPSNVKEARALIKSGVIPTHAFLLLSEEKESTALSCYNDVGQGKKNSEKLRSTTPSILLEFENSLHRLNEMYLSSLKTIKTNGKSIEEIAKACARLTLKLPHRRGPKLFRVVIIGPRGSRRRTVAKILNRKYNLAIIDMEHLIKVGRVMENELGDEIRWLDDNNSLYSKRIVFELLKNRLTKPDCLERGYVLINFPTCLEDFVLLDSTDTPPNRVIFFEIESNECQERLGNRVVNENTGRLYSKLNISDKDNNLLNSQSFTHPDDDVCTVSEELKFYNARKKALMDYCVNTSSKVDARGPITALVERVEAVLMTPSPAAEPRSGKLPTNNSLKKYLLRDKLQSSHHTIKSKMSYPISRIDVVPMIDSESLIKRYDELQRGPHDKRSDYIPSEKSLTLGHIYDNKEPGPAEIALEEGGNTLRNGNTDNWLRNDFQGNEIHTIMPHCIDKSIHTVSSTEIGRVVG